MGIFAGIGIIVVVALACIGLGVVVGDLWQL